MKLLRKRILVTVGLALSCSFASGAEDYDYFCDSIREQFKIKASLIFAPDKKGTHHVRLQLGGVSLGSAVGGKNRSSEYGRYDTLYSRQSTLPGLGADQVPMIRDGRGLEELAPVNEQDEKLWEELRNRRRRSEVRPLGVDQAHGPIEGGIGLGSFPAGQEGHFEGETLLGKKSAHGDEAFKKNHLAIKWAFDVEKGAVKNVRLRMVARSQENGKQVEKSIRCGEGGAVAKAGNEFVEYVDCD